MLAPRLAALAAALVLVAACKATSAPAEPEPPAMAAPADAAPADAALAAALADAAPPADAGPADATAAPADAAPPPPTPCPSSLDDPDRAGPCTLGDRCQVPDGLCFCDGYHGGIPPRPGVDYSHWACGRSRNRSDGCPDDLRAGARCRQSGQRCAELEGLFCGQLLECRRRRWVPIQDTCSTIPRSPPQP